VLTTITKIGLVFSAATIFTQIAHAAIELEKVKGENSYTIKISKSVHFGDVEKFQAVVDEVKKRKLTIHMNAIQLDVYGGEPSAARVIGRIIRHNKFNTFVAPDKDCVSACVYLAISGVRRMIYGSVLVHRFALVNEKLTDEQISQIITEHLKEANAYVLEMGGSVKLIEATSFTPNWALRRLSRDEVNHWGVFGSEHVEDEILFRRSAKLAGVTPLEFNSAYVKYMDICKKQEYSFKELATRCTVNQILKSKSKANTKTLLAQ
jgi:hypothetical protein